MNEKEAREIVEKRPDEWLSWTEKMWIAEGYLQAIEKANRLADGVRYALTKGNSGDAEKALKEYEKEK